MKTLVSAWLMTAAALHVAAQTNSSNAISIHDNTNSPPARAAVFETKELSGWTADVAKLAAAGVSDDVVYSFIDNSGTFNLDAEQIIQLREKRVPSQFVVAMIQHDAEVVSGARPLTITGAPTKPMTIQFVLAPAATAKEKNPPGAPASQNASPQAAEENTFEAVENWPEPAPATPVLAKANDSTYRVRQSYPEQVTPPILLFKAAAVQPNTLIIQFGP